MLKQATFYRVVRIQGMYFYLKKSKLDTCLIMMRINDSQFLNGRFVYSTKERIERENWLKKAKKTGGWPKKGHEDLEERLLEIKKAATAYIRTHRRDLTSEGLRSHLDGERPKEERKAKQEQPTTLLEEWLEYLKVAKAHLKSSSYTSYKGTYNLVAKFLMGRGWSLMLPGQFSYRHYQALTVWLREEVTYTDNDGNECNYSTNQIAKTLKRFKMFAEWLAKMRVNIDMNLEDIKYKEVPGRKISLTEEELNKLYNHEFSGNLVRVRDLFYIHCSTGLRISDLFRLDENIKNGKIILETKKVEGKHVEIPLPPRVKTILEKYNYRIPRMNEQDYRLGIKAVYKEINPHATIQLRNGNGFETVYVHEEISSHDAVRTFVTLSHEKGMSVASIAKIVNKDVKTLLRHYLVESQKAAEHDFVMAWG